MPIIMQQPQGAEGGSGKFNSVDIPSGMYPATLKTVEVGERPNFDDKTKMEPCIHWTFEVHGKSSSVELITDTSMSFNSGLTFGKESKAHKFAAAILNELPPDGFDLEALVGKSCQVMVERKQSKKPDKDGNLKHYAVIINVLPSQDSLPF